MIVSAQADKPNCNTLSASAFSQHTQVPAKAPLRDVHHQVIVQIVLQRTILQLHLEQLHHGTTASQFKELKRIDLISTFYHPYDAEGTDKIYRVKLLLELE
jgi:hypothetical protein